MDEETVKIIEKLCRRAYLHEDPVKILPLAPSGSRRRYFRLMFPTGSLVACISPEKKENETFIRLSRYLKGKGISVPEIIAVSEDSDAYLLQDLGDEDLLGEIRKTARTIEEKKHLWTVIDKSVSMLVKFQQLPKDEWDKKVEFAPLDASLISYDCRYAVNNLIIPSGCPYEEEKLNGEFNRLEEILLSYPPDLWGLMYRDFQSRNIMVENGEPYFIDYQSSRFGPGIYDLVSFAWQAKAGFTKEERQEIISLYCREYGKKPGGRDISQIIGECIPYWATFRIIQTLGAYGLRGLKEGKRHFIESIPPALHHLREVMSTHGLEKEFPELAGIIRRLLTFL